MSLGESGRRRWPFVPSASQIAPANRKQFMVSQPMSRRDATRRQSPLPAHRGPDRTCCGTLALRSTRLLALAVLINAIAMLPAAADESIQLAAPPNLAGDPAEPQFLDPQPGTVQPGHQQSKGCQECQGGQTDCQHCRGSSGVWNRLRCRWASFWATPCDPACAEPLHGTGRPFGEAVMTTNQLQIARGEAARMVLHHFDFTAGEATLNYRGEMQLRKIVAMAAQNPFPIIVEATHRFPELDSARLAQVRNRIEDGSVPIPPERVILNSAPARALDGLDATLIHENLLQQTSSGAAASTMSGGGSSPAGGAPGF